MPRKAVGNFSVEHLQILDETGKLDAALEPALGKDDLVRLYRAMFLAREADQRMLKLQRQGRMGTFPLSTGQEAAVCGSVFAMSEKDWYVGAYRDLGGRLMRGEPLANYFTYWNGWEEGNVSPSAGRTLPTSVVVGAQMLHAVGIGYAAKYRGEKDTAVVTFFGDGATSEGDFHEAMNYASVWQTPVVFICQNNHYAISIPRAKQCRSATLAQKAIAYEMPGVQVDGNDVLAVYQATKEALDRAKAGGGPSFIEALTYRLMHHTTSDDPTKYRLDAEEKEWWKKDPLPRFRSYLEKKGFWNEQAQSELEAGIQAEVDHAVRDFESRNSFRPDAPFDNVFGTRHPEIERQRADFLANLQAESAGA